MNNCIFCKKHTNNEYTYYVADKPDDTREKVTVCACTKCLKKKGVITLSIISFFFVLTLIGQIINLATGSQPVEIGGLITLLVLLLLLLFLIFYRMYEIKTDKPLSETKAAKKMIWKAKKINPAKFYFTPTENTLLPIKHEEKTKDPLLTLYEAVQNGKDINIEVITTASIEHLIRLYGSTSKGEGFLIGSNAAERVRMVGELLNKVGGFQLMLAVHKQFAASYHIYGAARNLEMVWNGIGGWQG